MSDVGYSFEEERQHSRLIDLAEWLVSLDDDDPASPGRKDRQTVTLTQIINRARAALDGKGE